MPVAEDHGPCFDTPFWTPFPTSPPAPTKDAYSRINAIVIEGENRKPRQLHPLGTPDQTQAGGAGEVLARH